MVIKPPDTPAGLSQQVRRQEQRKLRARRHSAQRIWQGLGMMGMVGWSVAVPALGGTALGLWLDRHYPGSHSWTLALLVAGLCLGCGYAWQWVSRESRRDVDGTLEQDDAEPAPKLPGEENE